jgi:exodeoxyribonuclease V beta subunit
MLEEMNFASADEAHLHDLARRGLERYGYSDEWQESAVQMLQQTVATPLIEGVALNQLQPGQWLPEMEFHYPLKALSGDKLMALLKEHDFGVGTAIAERLRNRSFSPVSGYMKGFIDLIFVANGRYYLADYKSNWLGPDDSAYNGEVMNNAIAEADYFLQYLIYSVALQRYLKSRLPNYRYESHFGGCLYLFLRGMGAEPTIGNSDEQPGVYFDRPAEALLDSLSQLVG